MGIFSKKEKKQTETQRVNIQTLNYHPKIILAWNECLNGNEAITNWLLENNYKELVIVSSILHYEDSGRDWLMKNGFPHLLAFINTIEGKEDAAHWLELNNMKELKIIAEAAGDDEKSWLWVLNNCTEDWILICRTIRKIRAQNGD